MALPCLFSPECSWPQRRQAVSQPASGPTPPTSSLTVGVASLWWKWNILKWFWM